MAHTLPPWTTKYRMVKVFANVDNNELAARLGALSTEDRRGDIIWYDDFEADAIHWWKEFSGGTPTMALDTTRAYRGNQCMKLTTDGDNNNWLAMRKEFQHPNEVKIGAECMIKFPLTKAQVTMSLDGYTGSAFYTGQIRYDIDAGEIQYYASPGGWTKLNGSLYDAANKEIWHLMKLVIDWEAKEYVRVIISDMEYNLSGKALVATAIGTSKHIIARVRLDAKEAVAKTCYVDNFIFTQNEP